MLPEEGLRAGNPHSVEEGAVGFSGDYTGYSQNLRHEQLTI